jgi:hypothetical protein
VVNFAPQPLYPRGKFLGTHGIGGWLGHRAGLDDVEKTTFLTLPGLELQYFGRPAHSAVAIPTELSRLDHRIIPFQNKLMATVRQWSCVTIYGFNSAALQEINNILLINRRRIYLINYRDQLSVQCWFCDGKQSIIVATSGYRKSQYNQTNNELDIRKSRVRPLILTFCYQFTSSLGR